MRSALHQFLPTSAEATVDEAVDLASRFAAAKKDEENYAGRSIAIEEIAEDSDLRPSLIKRLVEPARRPKTVNTHERNRLLAAYLGYLDRKRVAIEDEIARVEKMARPDRRAIQDLLDRARALASHIETLL